MIYLHGLTDKHCRVSQSAKDESAVTQGLLKKHEAFETDLTVQEDSQYSTAPLVISRIALSDSLFLENAL